MHADGQRYETDRTSQSTRAVLALRELILTGELGPGERLSELSLVARLGVSRTPIRSALARLESEGLIEGIAGGGFAVKTFTERDALEAIDIRGALEGLAVRFAAERGVSRERMAALDALLAAMDALVASGPEAETFASYIRLNAEFHDVLTTLAAGPELRRQIERANAQPFASPSAFVAVQGEMPRWFELMRIAHDQHRCIAEAIEQREGARAEALVREHARLAARHWKLALNSRSTLSRVSGGRLLRPQKVS
jgi:GntR family transcriptional regulator of vanillate catabolism